MTTEKAKLVITKDPSGNENGWLMELFKDGDKTLSYLTVTKPGAFKGYHLHRLRTANFICVKGKVRLITYTFNGDYEFHGEWTRDEVILEPGDRVTVPPFTPTALESISEEDSWLINYPNPAFDPTITDEQVEYTLQELEEGVVK